jgi:hypothetical protein
VVLRHRRELDNLPAKPLYKRKILRFRVADDDVVLREQKDIDDFTLGREGFARAGRAEEKPVWVIVKGNFLQQGNVVQNKPCEQF